MGAEAWEPDALTHTLLQGFLHVEERVGNAADSPHDLKACLLMVLEHSVSVECQQVVGHAAHIQRLQTQIKAHPWRPSVLNISETKYKLKGLNVLF